MLIYFQLMVRCIGVWFYGMDLASEHIHRMQSELFCCFSKFIKYKYVTYKK